MKYKYKDKELRDAEDSNRIYLEFIDRFFNDMDLEGALQSKYIGYNLMTRVTKWAKKYPKEVHIVFCDDHLHASSIIILIEARSRNSYHGIHMVTIPQCTGENPQIMFLYKQHSDMLLETLQKIQNKQNKVKCL
jgi:hypothetical protein